VVIRKAVPAAMIVVVCEMTVDGPLVGLKTPTHWSTEFKTAPYSQPLR